mmetsp:Transcript_1941/g.6379  ORF Transcript_1941/g.6379 Transcript_1941/m.6379 type:complete len:398 (-) Transcript_1941:27-1220(-)
MPHAAPLLRGMAFEADAAGARDEAGTTYLMARDEDGENMFHSAADFLNAYLVSRVLGSDRSDWVTVLFDRMPDFAYTSLIEKTFSRRGPPRRAADYGGRVRFETLVFHLESPAGIVRRPAAATTFERCLKHRAFGRHRRAPLRAQGHHDVPAVEPLARLPERGAGRLRAAGRGAAEGAPRRAERPAAHGREERGPRLRRRGGARGRARRGERDDVRGRRPRQFELRGPDPEDAVDERLGGRPRRGPHARALPRGRGGAFRDPPVLPARPPLPARGAHGRRALPADAVHGPGVLQGHVRRHPRRRERVPRRPRRRGARRAVLRRRRLRVRPDLRPADPGVGRVERGPPAAGREGPVDEVPLLTHGSPRREPRWDLCRRPPRALGRAAFAISRRPAGCA